MYYKEAIELMERRKGPVEIALLGLIKLVEKYEENNNSSAILEKFDLHSKGDVVKGDEKSCEALRYALSKLTGRAINVSEIIIRKYFSDLEKNAKAFYLDKTAAERIIVMDEMKKAEHLHTLYTDEYNRAFRASEGGIASDRTDKWSNIYDNLKQIFPPETVTVKLLSDGGTALDGTHTTEKLRIPTSHLTKLVEYGVAEKMCKEKHLDR